MIYCTKSCHNEIISIVNIANTIVEGTTVSWEQAQNQGSYRHLTVVFHDFPRQKLLDFPNFERYFIPVYINKIY